ncbi:MAG: DUF192 domain-containing protein [Candidatus Omnitrophica bacterium]|nr:DUF192 domain-containing protein [Candidatus Omnitrophota bacterium]
MLGRTSIALDEGLLITHCNSIHMFFMKFSIDAVFLDKNNKVVGLVERIAPFQLSPIFWNADKVVELAPETIQNKAIQKNHILEII